MSTIESSVIDQLGYNESEQTLEIKFTGGNHYRYFGVSREIVGKLLLAKSAGTFFAKNIRGAFRYELVTA